MNVDQFVTILNDRTFNWKLRSTVDYSPADVDDKFYEKMAVEAMPKGAKRKLGVDMPAQTDLSEGDFFNNSSLFLQKKEAPEEIYEGISAPKESPSKNKSRKIIFNILDLNMDGQLSLKEFFELIKFYNVFNYLAGDRYKQNPWFMTRRDYDRNSDAIIKKGAVVGFPSDAEKEVLKNVEFMTLVSEVNFKEFLITFKYGNTLKQKEIANSMNGVTLVDLMTYLNRCDLKVTNPRSFLLATNTPNPMGGTAYSYPMAISWALKMEQFAILNLNADKQQKDFNIDLSKFEKTDNELGGDRTIKDRF